VRQLGEADLLGSGGRYIEKHPRLSGLILEVRVRWAAFRRNSYFL
jgi:hypothetical protein